jgi:hypothetical protein
MTVIALSLSLPSASATLQVRRVPTVYVVDGNTNTPIEGAAVYLDDIFRGTTDSFGALSMGTLSASTYRLRISKEEYTTYETTINTLLSPKIVARIASTGATPVFRTDFEGVTKKDANRLNMGIDNWFEFEGSGGASMWVEGLDRSTPGLTPHSGSRCVGMELTDISKSRRNEFNILDLENLVGDELFVSVWLYLPADWPIQGSSNDWSWYSMAVPFMEGGPAWAPYSAIQIRQEPQFKLAVNYRGVDQVESFLDTHVDFPLPRGRWFNVQWYVFRHPTDGILKIWVDGMLVTNRSGLQTKGSTEEWFTTVAKIYYNPNSKYSRFKIWADDLEIWNHSIA